MTTPDPRTPQHPIVLGDARDAQHMSLEDRQRHQQAVRGWQDQQASHLNRQAAKARLKAFAATTFGSLLILGFLAIQVQKGRVDPPALILIPTVLALVLIVATLVLPPWPDVAKALRQHKKARRAEKRQQR